MKEVLVILKPSAGWIDLSSHGTVTPLTLEQSFDAGLTLADYVGKKALKIIKRSIRHQVASVSSIGFDMMAQRYEVVVVPRVNTKRTTKSKANLDRLISDLDSNYGSRAGDTWMEGDISLRESFELHLELVAVLYWNKL